MDELLAIPGVIEAKYAESSAVLVTLYKNGPTVGSASTPSGKRMDSAMPRDPASVPREASVRMNPWAPTYVTATMGLANIEAEYTLKS
jgi:hypothetical protein